MRIALLTTHFAPDEASNSLIATRLAEAWARAGHDVWVGTTHSWYRADGELSGPPAGSVRVHRSRAAKGRLGTYLNYHLAFPTWLGELRSADVIVSMSPPITVGTAAALAGVNRPTLYNVQDVFPEVVMRSGRMRDGALFRALEMLERFTYARSGHLVTVGNSQRRFLVQRDIDPAKITTIENFADTEAIHPAPVEWAYRRSLGISDDAVVALYAGNFGLVNELQVLLGAIELLTGQGIHFLLAGGGREWHQAATFAKGRADVTVVGHRPSSELQRLYAAANVGLLALRRGLSACSVPSKTYTILASGRPFVAAIDGDSDIADLAVRSGAGIVSAPGDARAFADAILRLARQPDAMDEMGRRGRAYVVEHNSPWRIARRYEDLFRSLMA